jgi:hypothetical protein
LKREFAAKLGITLIPIPFWWDKSSASLAATLLAYRPDLPLVAKAKDAISTMPLKLQRKFKYKPTFPVSYAEQDPTGW